MNNKGLDYNTGRSRLTLPDYGREIQKMVDYAVALPTKAERQRCAETIVKMMVTRVPQIKGNAGYQQTLWDHLYIIAQDRLDIDWPNDTSKIELTPKRPQRLEIPQKEIRLRHYGNLIEQMTDLLKTMPPGPRRDKLAIDTANRMKHDLALWGYGSASDEHVIDDIARMTDGAVQLDPLTTKLKKVVVEQQPAGKKKKKK